MTDEREESTAAGTELVYRAEFRSGYRAELTVSASNASIVWKPDQPRGMHGQRGRKFLRAYRAWRDECLADFAKRAGISVVVVDL